MMNRLVDFDPATGHQSGCARVDCDCANILYSMHVRMEDVLGDWDRISKGVGPTTRTLRTARDHPRS